MCKGFKQISNDFFESDYWRQSRTYNDCEAVLDIINQVRFEASEHYARIGGREVSWGQAEWPASVRFLAARWKWTEWKVRTFLSGLRRKGVIETTDKQGVNIIRLKKYLVLATQQEEQSTHTDSHTQSHTDNGLNINELVKNITQQVTQRLTQQKPSDSHSTHTKHNNGDISSIPPLSPKGETAFDWSLVSDDMKPVIEDWLAYKREKKQTYKPRGFKQFCQTLIRLSGNNPSKARIIIEQSMTNNYAGIFELKNRRYETSANAGSGRCVNTAPSDQQLIFDSYDLIDEARAGETAGNNK